MAASPKILSLFSGCGMLDQSIRLVFPGARTLVYVEREAFASAVLAARMAEGSLDDAPIWSELATFDATPLRGRIEIVAGSPPCQPYSLAGKREGNSDHRSHGAGDGPIVHMLRIIGECRPALVFFENVGAWVCGGWFRPVGEALCRMGYTVAQPVFLAASDVGASHQRERVFVLAYLADAMHGTRGAELKQQLGQWANEPGRSEREMADAQQPEFSQPQASERHRTAADAGTTSKPVADPGDRLLSQPGRGSQGRAGVGSAGDIVGQPDGEREQQPHDEAGAEPRREPRRSAGRSGSGLAEPHAGIRMGQRVEHRVNQQILDSGRWPNGKKLTAEKRAELEQRQQQLAELADSGRERLQGQLQERPTEGPIGRSGRMPLFAPGPADMRAWGYVLERWPWLAPAIETQAQSGDGLLVDGYAASPMDFARADQLRGSGNSVVAIQGAVALIVALHRAGIA